MSEQVRLVSGKKVQLVSLPPIAPPYIVDLGCGDGKFILTQARNNPHQSFLGIDAALPPLKYAAAQANRWRLTNIAFICAAAEALPKFLHANVSKLYVQFPWGSLLAGLAGRQDSQMLSNIRQCLAESASLEATLTYDPKLDGHNITSLDLLDLADQKSFTAKYHQAGLIITKFAGISAQHMQNTSWRGRLLASRSREIVLLQAQPAIIAQERQEAKV